MWNFGRVWPWSPFAPWLMVALWTSLASAEPSAEPESTASDGGRAYQATIQQALDEYALEHWEEARTLFAKAHVLAPSARTWRGLGMVEFELRNYPACVEDLERALTAEVKPLEGPLRAETEALLERAREFVGRVVLSLHPPLTTFSLLVDGASVSVQPSGLHLAVGDHVLEVRADGFLPAKRTLHLMEGRVEQVRLDLLPDEREPARTASPVDTKRPLYKNPWLWTGVAVVLVGAAATVTGVLLSRDPEPHATVGDPEVAGGLIQTLRWGR